MSVPDEERWETLESVVARLERQQADLTGRIWRIEQALTLPAQARATSSPLEPVRETPAATLPVDAAPSTPANLVFSSFQEPAPDRPGLETRMGLTWINRIGAITLVLGVGFFFKYAIDNQWIGETGRVLLGILAGIATLGVGDVFWKRDQKVFAQGISGTGLAILYLALYAAYGFYHLVSIVPAFTAMALTTALAGALALRYGASAIAGLGLFGGYATPLFLSTGQDHPWFFFSYLLLLNAAAVAIGRVKRWRGIEWLSLLATAFLFARWSGLHFNPEKQFVATLFALLFYGLFASSGVRPIVYGAQFAASAGVAAFLASSPAAYAFLSWSLAAVGLVIAETRNWPPFLLVSLGSFWFSYALWTAKSQHPLGIVLALLSSVFVLYLAFVARRARISNEPLTGEYLLALPLNAGSYFAMIYGLLEPQHHATLGAIATGVAAVHLGLATLLRDGQAEAKWLCAFVGTAFVTLAIPIQFAGFRITMAWALEAAATVWIGIKAGARVYVDWAMVVLALILARLAVFDSQLYASPELYVAVFNLRFLTFVTAAASFWLASKWMASSVERRPRVLVTYAAGHVVMLWGIILEVLGWAARNSARENLQSVESASISIWMALYAVVLVTIGVLTRTAVNRMGGLALIGLVVVKLYVYDVWRLVRIYRVAAFAALGGLLLLTSYLYSRYRESIENWWSDEKPAA